MLIRVVRRRAMAVLAVVTLPLPTACLRSPLDPRASEAPSALARSATSLEQREEIGSGSVIWYVDGREVTAREAHALRPEAIRSVEVMKGKAATKRYGVRAANGVVLVTTHGATDGARR